MGERKTWDAFSAAMCAKGVEGYATADRGEYVSAWQYLIDTGICWKLQGWFGRTARDMILIGECTMPQ